MKKVLNILKYLVFLGLGFAVFFYVYPPSEFDDTLEMLKKANYIYVVPVVMIALLAHYSRGVRWKMLIEPLGYEMKSFSAFRSVMIGYYFNTLVPRLGEVSRCIALNRIEKVPLSIGLGTVVTERIFDLMALGIVVGLTVLLEFELVGGYIIDLIQDRVASSGSLFSLTTFLVLAGAAAAVALLVFLVRKLGVYDKILGILAEFKKGFTSVFKLKNPWVFLAHTVFIWVGYYAMCYLSFYTLPETSDLGLSAGLVVFTLSTIGFLAPVPGGTGTYQYMFVIALGLYAIDDETSKAVAMIAFLVNTLLNLIVGAIALWLSPEKIKVNAPTTE